MSDLFTAEIIGFAVCAEGPAVSLRCQRCAGEFQARIEFVAGMALGSYQCPGCLRDVEIQPNDLVAFLATFSGGDRERERLIEQETFRICSTWYRNDLLSGVLYHKGVNLGEICERQVSDLVAFGMFLEGFSGKGDV